MTSLVQLHSLENKLYTTLFHGGFRMILGELNDDMSIFLGDS